MNKTDSAAKLTCLIFPSYSTAQPSYPTLLGWFLFVRSKRHFRCCSKLLIHLFIYFGHSNQPYNHSFIHSALSIALWVRFPIIWSTNVRQTWAGRWKFRTFLFFFCSYLSALVERDLFFFWKKQLLAGIAIVIGIPFPIWIYYKGEGLRARNPLTKMSTIPKRIS